MELLYILSLPLFLLALLVITVFYRLTNKVKEDKFHVIQFRNGKYGLQHKAWFETKYYDQNLEGWQLDSGIEKFCQFDTIEEVEEIKKRLDDLNEDGVKIIKELK